MLQGSSPLSYRLGKKDRGTSGALGGIRFAACTRTHIASADESTTGQEDAAQASSRAPLAS